MTEDITARYERWIATHQDHQLINDELDEHRLTQCLTCDALICQTCGKEE